jgi:hypothetical protein
MTRSHPAGDCREMPLPAPCLIEPPAQVALEDYARVLTGAAAAEAIERAPGEVVAVHLCGLAKPLAETAAADIIAFTRELAAASPGGGLGWS